MNGEETVDYGGLIETVRRLAEELDELEETLVTLAAAEEARVVRSG